MEKYYKILQESQYLFPHNTNVKVEITTNQKDLKTFNNDLEELKKIAFVIGNIENTVLTNHIKTPFGEIKLIIDENS